jgi:hypothetical protein
MGLYLKTNRAKQNFFVSQVAFNFLAVSCAFLQEKRSTFAKFASLPKLGFQRPVKAN